MDHWAGAVQGCQLPVRVSGGRWLFALVGWICGSTQPRKGWPASDISHTDTTISHLHPLPAVKVLVTSWRIFPTPKLQNQEDLSSPALPTSLSWEENLPHSTFPLTSLEGKQSCLGIREALPSHKRWLYKVSILLSSPRYSCFRQYLDGHLAAITLQGWWCI